MCGKTGTAQKTHGKDNSVFVAFAPRENPKIAIAVVVEAAGQGAAYAAPIASFLVEKYLTDKITSRPSGATPEWFMDKNVLPDPSFYQTQKTKPDTGKKPAPKPQVKSAAILNKKTLLPKPAAE